MTIQLFVDIQAEYQRLQQTGVFDSLPPPTGPTVIAAFGDNCGNLVQIGQAG